MAPLYEIDCVQTIALVVITLAICDYLVVSGFEVPIPLVVYIALPHLKKHTCILYGPSFLLQN